MAEKIEQELEHPDVFRAPTPREHRIAAALFIGMAVGFVLLFYVLNGWWFRWVILAIGAYSFLDGVRHLRSVRARHLGPERGHERS